MTIQQEAYQLIDSMSEDNVRSLVELIQGLVSGNKASIMPNVRYDENIRVANMKKLDKIADLKDDWNGNGAKAIPRAVIEKTRNILESIYYQPEVFPLATDAIQLEYDMRDGSHLEIEISESDHADCFMIDSSGQESSEEIAADVTSINERIAVFYG